MKLYIKSTFYEIFCDYARFPFNSECIKKGNNQLEICLNIRAHLDDIYFKVKCIFT